MLSRLWANRIIFVLSLVGVIVALMLTLKHMAAVDLPCGPMNGCDEVAQHPTASGFGIPALRAVPTAAFGLAAYVVLVALAVARVLTVNPVWERRFAQVTLALAAAGTLVAAWLTYVEAAVIKAWCTWCVASAVIMLLVLVISALEWAPGRPVSQGEAP